MSSVANVRSGPGSPSRSGAARANDGTRLHSKSSAASDRPIKIERADAADIPAIAALLQAAGLPADDFAPHVANFFVARAAGKLVGAIGAERAGAEALLRSLVVADEYRAAGLGGKLVERLEREGAGWGVKRWWLLTTTAEDFFAARGFTVTARADAPAGIQRTGQFSGGCSGCATCMSKSNRPTTADPDSGARNGAGGTAPASGTVEFDAAIAEFTAKLRAFIRRRVRDDATADDLTQDTLLKVYRSRTALRDGQRLEAWVYRIARTTLIDFYRRTRPTEELPATIAAEQPEEVEQWRAAVLRSTERFLGELPEAYREPVRLAEMEGLPLAKIALRLDLSLTAVKSRVRRGRAMLKKKLQDCCRFEFDRMGKVIGYERRQRGTPCADRTCGSGAVAGTSRAG